MRKTTINGVEIRKGIYDKDRLVFEYHRTVVFQKKHIPKLIKTLESFLNEKPTKKYDKANYLKARVG